MMRTTGFLAGVALTVAALLLVLDSRESQQPETVAPATADATPAELSGVFEAIAEQVDVVQEKIEPDREIPPQLEAGTADGKPQSGFEAPRLDPDHRLKLQADAQADDADRQHSGDAGTYLFWSPFRSAWSAQGFAGRLSSATQVPVEVINAGPGEYRVAFSYQDETERLARIEHIETITGLKLE